MKKWPQNSATAFRILSTTPLICFYKTILYKDAWIQKFARNAERMKRNFKRDNQRCGYYDAEQLPHGGPERKRREAEWDRYDREYPEIGIKGGFVDH